MCGVVGKHSNIPRNVGMSYGGVLDGWSWRRRGGWEWGWRTRWKTCGASAVSGGGGLLGAEGAEAEEVMVD